LSGTNETIPCYKKNNSNHEKYNPLHNIWETNWEELDHGTREKYGTHCHHCLTDTPFVLDTLIAKKYNGCHGTFERGESLHRIDNEEIVHWRECNGFDGTHL